ncbi:MAG TPA: response regulator [Planctomycetota bacterium]|nr:response regulator [Planctomycetota bacterium]
MLLVDDDPSDRQAVERVLVRSSSCRIVSAPTLEAARERLRTAQFDAVILDLALVDGWGTELIDACGGAPIIVLTAHDSQLLATELKKRGVADYLVKDVALHFLRELPERLLRVFPRQPVVRPPDGEAELLQQAVAGLRQVIWVRRPDGSFAYVSPSVERVLGVPAATLRARADAWVEALPAAWRFHFGAQVAAALTGELHEFEYPRELPAGQQQWLHEESRGLRDAAGNVKAIVGCTSDSTATRDSLAELRLRLELAMAASHVDADSGLWSRGSFAALLRADKELAAERGKELTFCVVYAPATNGTPVAGGRSLRDLGAWLQGVLGTQHVAARLCEPAIAILLRDAPRPEAMALAQSLLRTYRRDRDGSELPAIGLLHVRAAEPMAALDAAVGRLHGTARGGVTVLDESPRGRVAIAMVHDLGAADAMSVLIDFSRSNSGRRIGSDTEAGLNRLLAERICVGRLALPDRAVPRAIYVTTPALWLDLPAAAVAELVEIAKPSQLQFVVPMADLGPRHPLLARWPALRGTGAGLVVSDPDLGAAALEVLAVLAPQAIELDFSVMAAAVTGRDHTRHDLPQRLVQVAHGLDAKVLVRGIASAGDRARARAWQCDLGRGPLWQ